MCNKVCNVVVYKKKKQFVIISSLTPASQSVGQSVFKQVNLMSITREGLTQIPEQVLMLKGMECKLDNGPTLYRSIVARLSRLLSAASEIDQLTMGGPQHVPEDFYFFDNMDSDSNEISYG